MYIFKVKLCGRFLISWRNGAAELVCPGWGEVAGTASCWRFGHPPQMNATLHPSIYFTATIHHILTFACDEQSNDGLSLPAITAWIDRSSIDTNYPRSVSGRYAWKSSHSKVASGLLKTNSWYSSSWLKRLSLRIKVNLRMWRGWSQSGRLL